MNLLLMIVNHLLLILHTSIHTWVYVCSHFRIHLYFLINLFICIQLCITTCFLFNLFICIQLCITTCFLLNITNYLFYCIHLCVCVYLCVCFFKLINTEIRYLLFDWTDGFFLIWYVGLNVAFVDDWVIEMYLWRNYWFSDYIESLNIFKLPGFSVHCFICWIGPWISPLLTDHAHSLIQSLYLLFIKCIVVSVWTWLTLVLDIIIYIFIYIPSIILMLYIHWTLLNLLLLLINWLTVPFTQLFYMDIFLIHYFLFLYLSATNQLILIDLNIDLLVLCFSFSQ